MSFIHKNIKALSKKLNIFIIVILALIFISLIILSGSLMKKETMESFDNKNENIQEKKLLVDHYNKKHKLLYTFDKYRPNFIFVSIASYRDDECMTTIKSLYEKAQNPHRVICGICSQNKDEKEECVPKDFPYKDKIRVIRLKHTDAKGPTWARYLASHLWNGEEYFLQIDSHLKMKDNWDERVIKMYQDCPSKKSILTHYPPEDEKDNNSTYTCSSHYENNFHIISEAQIISKRDKPFMTPYVSAGFLFGKYTFLNEVPFDPYLPYLFQGEEILLATRFWTNGWDIYNLTEPMCVHNYSRDKKPRFWNDNSHQEWHTVQQESNKRYYYFIGQKKPEDIEQLLKKNEDYFGMGRERTVQSWFEFAGIDPKTKKVTSRCKSMYNLETKQWEPLK